MDIISMFTPSRKINETQIQKKQNNSQKSEMDKTSSRSKGSKRFESLSYHITLPSAKSFCKYNRQLYRILYSWSEKINNTWKAISSLTMKCNGQYFSVWGDLWAGGASVIALSFSSFSSIYTMTVGTLHFWIADSVSEKKHKFVKNKIQAFVQVWASNWSIENETFHGISNCPVCQPSHQLDIRAMLLQQCCIYIKQMQTYIRKRTCCSACVTQACDLGQSFVEHIDYKTLLSPDQSAVFNHPWIGYCQKKSRYHLKMIQLVVKVVVVCCFCAQILEGSPLHYGLSS